MYLCIIESTLKSNANIPILALSKIIKSLSTVIKTKLYLKSKYKLCIYILYTKFENFKKYFTKFLEDLIKLTLCHCIVKSNLICWNKVPKLYYSNYNNGTCALYGISNTNIQKRSVYSEYVEVMKYIL